jgi:hypothetical protein
VGKFVSFFAVLALIAALYIPMPAIADSGEVEITGIGLSPSAFGAAYSPSSSTDLVVHGYVDTGESPPSGRQIRVTLQNAVNNYRAGSYFSTDISRVNLPSFLEAPAVLIDGSDVIVTMDVKQITGNATGSFSVTFSYDNGFRGWVANGEKMADVTVASMDVTDPGVPVTLSSKNDSVVAEVGTYGWAYIDKSDGNSTIVPPDSVRTLDLRLSGTGLSGSAYSMNRYFVPGTEFRIVFTFPAGAVVTGYGDGVLDDDKGTVTWTIPVGSGGLPESHTSSYLWYDSDVKISFPKDDFSDRAVSLSLTGYGQLVGDDASAAYAAGSLGFPVRSAIHMAPVVFRGFANCNVLIDEPETESLSYDGISELKNAGTEPVPGVKVTYYNDADGGGRKGRVSKISFARAAAAYKIKIVTYIYKYNGSAAGVHMRTVTTYKDQSAGAGVSVDMAANTPLYEGEYIDRLELYPLSAASAPPDSETNEVPVGVNFGVNIYYKSWGQNDDPDSWVFPGGATISPDSYTVSRFTASWADDYSPPGGATMDDRGVCTATSGLLNSVRYNLNAYNPIGIFSLNTTGEREPGEVLTGAITFGNAVRSANTYGSANWINPELYFIPPPNVIFDPLQTLYVAGYPDPVDISFVKTVNDKPVYRLSLPDMTLPPDNLRKTINGVSLTVKPGAARATNQQIVHPLDPYAAGNGGLLLTSRDDTEKSDRFTSYGTAYGYPASDTKYNLDDNPHTTRMLSAANSGFFTIPEATEMLAYSTLKNNETGEWKPARDPDAETTVALFGTGQYKLTVVNNGNTWMGEVRLLDILPHIGDVQVLSPYSARGSEWQAILRSVHLQMFDADHKPAPNQHAPLIRYSVQSDPDYSFNGGVQRSGRPDGAFSGFAVLQWARSFELVVPGRIPPGYSVEILVTVGAPPVGVTGQVAYNSFVATANFYETSVSQSVKTTTTFEPSKQKFILYRADDSVPSGGGIGGGIGDGEGGGDGENDGDSGDSGDEDSGGTGSGENSGPGIGSGGPYVVENVVKTGNGENSIVVSGGVTLNGESGVTEIVEVTENSKNAAAVTTGSSNRGKGSKDGNDDATASTSPQQPATTSPAAVSPAATSLLIASVGPDEPDADVIDDERTFSKESIKQFKLKSDGKSSVFKGLTIADEVMLRAQSGNAFVDLKDGNVPAGNLRARSVWSLLSLIMSLLAVVISVVLIVGAIFRRGRVDSGEYDLHEYTGDTDYDGQAAGEDEKMRKRDVMIRALTVALGALTLTVWRLLDDLSRPMTWMNQWTPIIAILFAAYITCLVIYLVRRAGRE